MYLITVEKRTLKKQVLNLKRVTAIVDATVGPQREYKKTIDNLEPKVG